MQQSLPDTVGVKPLALPWFEADERCPPTGLRRSGQPALTGLYGLSNHCSERCPQAIYTGVDITSRLRCDRRRTDEHFLYLPPMR